ncbi:MAG: ABC transporter ATP-binding protein [Candidatus Moranbacteria bacterium]|nr:ABC transporter ATP-binding protein [bacterium]MDP1833677.1 ABC transporter ATP-binding protein [Candidatus Moranbacteria bacterium]
MGLIQARNLNKTYDNEGVLTPAVKDVTFRIDKGEFVAIMGPSGSGKSTLMQMLGFLDRPTKGEYLFDGKNTESFSDDELALIRNKKVGFVFQAFNLLPRTSVMENVELPLLYDSQREKKEMIEKKVIAALKAVNMEHRATYLSNQLSGGEKQRVAVARALVNDPEVLFADEPTGNLDSKSGIQVMKILQKLNDDGHTIILVTHETFTAEHAKRIIMMKDGDITQDFPVQNRRIARDGEILK